MKPQSSISTNLPASVAKGRALMLSAGLAALAATMPAAPMDSISLEDFDFNDAQQARTQALIDNGTLELQRILTGPETGYRHMGWPVATRLPDGRTVVLIRNLLNHSAYDVKNADGSPKYPDNARRVIYSDDMASWLPADVLTAPPALGVNTAEDVATLGNYDYKGMQAISWSYPTGATNPRLVVVTGKHESEGTLPAAKLFRVYLSDDRGVTWREQVGALGALSTNAVHSGPNMVQHPEFGLVVPFGQQTGTGVNRQNYLASSKDAGETWQVRTWTNAANSRSIEPALVTWGPGHMAMIGRERTDAYGYDSDSGKYYYTQHVYKHTPGTPFSAVTFSTARTNIGGNGKTPIAKGKAGYEAHDTAEIIYNPVTGRIEMLQSSRWGNGAENPLPENPDNPSDPRNSLNLWSIDPVDLLAGKTTWRFDGNIVERQGIILGAVGLPKDNKDGYHPGSSIVDEAAGKQHIFVYVGVYTAHANAYRISRPLDTYAFRVASGLPALPAPAISTISDVDAHNAVTITGTNFTDFKEVLVAGKTAPIVSSSATEIKFYIPSGINVGDKIVVRTDNGLTTGVAHLTHVAPSVTAVAYDLIWAGKPVTITGTNLDLVNKVFFGTVEVTTFVSKTATQIVVNVPAGVADGVLSVQAPGGIATAPGGGAYSVAIKPTDLAPLVSVQPVVIGAHPLDFTASATGTPTPSYQWQFRRTEAESWADVANATGYEGASTAHLSIVTTTGKNGWQYRYVAKNQTEDVYSDPVTLQLLAEALPNPVGIVAAAGAVAPDLYVADAQTHVLRKITQADQKALVFAGQDGAAGTNDGNAAAARFNAPHGVTINAAGALIVADTGNSLIRTVTADGGVTTSATAFNQPRAAAAHDTNGDTYVADTRNHLIKKISANGTVTVVAGAGKAGFADGVGPAAQFNTPSGIAVDIAGNLYVADTGNHAIRYIDMMTGRVSTFAGRPGEAPGSTDGPAVGGTAATRASFKSPEGVAVDANGVVFVADTGNSLIREIHDGTVRTLAGQRPGIAGFKDGTGTNAWFDRPTAIVVAEGGDLYLADTGNAVIRRITSTDEVTTLPVEALTGNPDPSSNPGGGGGSGGEGPSKNGVGGSGGGAPGWWFLAALATLFVTRAFAGRP